MKVLFDCVLTAKPSKCSTTVQFITLAKMLMEDPTKFVYWPIPDRLTEEEKEAYPKHERILYIPIHQYKDRMKEYNRINDRLENLLSFNGDTWDWDVVVTVRSTMVSMMKVLALSPRQKHRAWSKRVVLIEDMMVLSKKPTVALSHPEVQDRMTIEAYLAADAVLMPAYHQKNWVGEVARQYFSPSTVMRALRNVREVCHLNLPEFKLKTDLKYKGDRPLGVCFTGRLERFGTRIGDVNEVMVKQFIADKEGLRLFVCTVTDGSIIFSKDIVEVLHPNRDEYWRICREEMDVAIVMSVDVELSASFLEMISFGVPLIVVKAPWSIAQFGDSYPFFIKNLSQAHAYISMFRKNYSEMYEQFMKWQKEWFVPTYTKRINEDGLYKWLMYEINRTDLEGKDMESLKNNAIVKLMNEKGGDEFVMFDLIDALGETDLETLAKKTEEGDRETRSLVFSTPWNEFRIALMGCYGWEDASVKTGHMRKKK
jgi:hypothetical protein